MQGVVDAQPVDREVAVLAEVSVGKEWVGEVAEFDEEALAESRLRQCVKQEAEDAFFGLPLGIFACAVDLSAPDERGWEEPVALADDAQQFAHRLLTSPGDKEERGIAGGTLADGEELPRVKEVVPLHLFGYVLAVAVDADCWFHGFPCAGARWMPCSANLHHTLESRLQYGSVIRLSGRLEFVSRQPVQLFLRGFVIEQGTVDVAVEKVGVAR